MNRGRHNKKYKLFNNTAIYVIKEVARRCQEQDFYCLYVSIYDDVISSFEYRNTIYKDDQKFINETSLKSYLQRLIRNKKSYYLIDFIIHRINSTPLKYYFAIYLN